MFEGGSFCFLVAPASLIRCSRVVRDGTGRDGWVYRLAFAAKENGSRIFTIDEVVIGFLLFPSQSILQPEWGA
jgi:hypothetical protein